MWGLIWWLAGQIPIEPWSFSLRELMAMHTAADFGRWTFTATIHSAIANSNRDPNQRKQPFTARNFHPHLLYEMKRLKQIAKAKEPTKKKADISILKAVFIEGASMDELIMEFDL